MSSFTRPSFCGCTYFDGDYGSPESWEDYHRTVAEWLANDRLLRFDDEESIEIRELVARYEEHAKVSTPAAHVHMAPGERDRDAGEGRHPGRDD